MSIASTPGKPAPLSLTMLRESEENPFLLINDLDAAIHALDGLLGLRPIGQLLQWISEKEFAEKLLKHFWLKLKNRKEGEELVHELVNFINENDAEPFDALAATIVYEFFGPLKRYYPDFLDLLSWNEAEKKFNYDQFWLERCRHWIVKGDVRHAYNELKRAYHGKIKNRQENSGPQTPAISGESRALPASVRTLKIIITELFERMLRYKMVEALGMERWENKPVRRFVPGASGKHHNREHAGYKLACAVSGFDYDPDSKDSKEQRTFGNSGVMILKIAGYFREKENARQRRRDERKLAAYKTELAGE